MYGLGFDQSDGAGIGMIITYAVFILVGIYYFIWNIVRGIKVLKTRNKISIISFTVLINVFKRAIQKELLFCAYKL